MKLAPSNFIQKSKLLLSLLFAVLITFSCEEESDCKETKCKGGYTAIYAPVCGCNDVTYSNSSEAECKGITSYTEGKCKKEEDENCEETKCEGGYTKIYAPVCGCNDVTYSNSSEAECKGITSYTEGKCKKEEDEDCEETKCEGGWIKIYAPVCGCNDITYSNSSEAECKGITSYTEGKCKKEDDPNCEEKKCKGSYIEVYDPVCGCNNVTYSNSSEAECKGITSYKKGKCKKKKCDNSNILSSEPKDAELEKNIKKWQSFNICNYSITNLIGCNCTEEYSTPKTLKIENGTLTHVGDKSYPAEELLNYKAVNEIFDFINELHSMETHILNVSYDEKYGFPTYLYVDYEEMIADDEISYELSKLMPFK